ncbi:MAG: sporulation initiation factor Spo0A C-terminal domain-containing protein [Eubacteriales bacterium]
MANRKILRKVAKQNGVSLKEVKADMQEAINYAYNNCPNDGVIEAYQRRVSKKNQIPNVDEFINYIVNDMKNNKKIR